MSNFQTTGRQLIDQLKTHILNTLSSKIDPTRPIHWRELQKEAGLEIFSIAGENVWEMGFLTLLIELKKEGRLIKTDAESESLNTADWSDATVRPLHRSEKK